MTNFASYSAKRWRDRAQRGEEGRCGDKDFHSPLSDVQPQSDWGAIPSKLAVFSLLYGDGILDNCLRFGYG